METEPRVYCKKPHTRPTNKLKLNFKAKMNPRLNDTMIIDAEEETVQA